MRPHDHGDDLPVPFPDENVAHEEASMHIADPTEEWCPICLKTTLLRASIYALVSDGPHRIGEYAVCETCGHSPYAEPEVRR